MLSTPASPSSPPPLQLDKRQRAMLKDMGIRVWSPLPDAAAPVAPVKVAPESIAFQAENTSTGGRFDQKITGFSPAEAAQADVAGAAADLAETPRARAASPGAMGASWQFAAPHALYADAAPVTPGGPRWLVLAETDATALQRSDFHPFDGEAGKLLDNMLRATRLAAPGRVVLVPMCRQLPGDTAAPGAGLPADPGAALAALIAVHQPQLLLVMGRLAAQALLNSTEPLGKLRGRVHMLHGVRTIVTYDAQPLLRTPADKAKAWDDLCLGVAQAAAGF